MGWNQEERDEKALQRWPGTVWKGNWSGFPASPTPSPQFQKGLELERGAILVWLLLWLLLQGSWAR